MADDPFMLENMLADLKQKFNMQQRDPRWVLQARLDLKNLRHHLHTVQDDPVLQAKVADGITKVIDKLQSNGYLIV